MSGSQDFSDYSGVLSTEVFFLQRLVEETSASMRIDDDES